MMGAPATNTNAQFDTATAKKTYDQIIAKYEKRYKKALNDDQYALWKDMSSTKLDNKFNSILQHVQENTESMF